tara:strand:+ start:377 stop:619 length:243 start_codon:yes stop_codon:yes gene_type:complete
MNSNKKEIEGIRSVKTLPRAFAVVKIYPLLDKEKNIVGVESIHNSDDHIYTDINLADTMCDHLNSRAKYSAVYQVIEIYL